MRAIAVVLLAWPLLANDGTKLVQVTTTGRVNFTPSGAIHINDSSGGLSVEGWDRPEVEITVTKSAWSHSASEQEQEASRRLEKVQVVTKRNSSVELTISTIHPSRGGLFSWLPKRKGSVSIEYEIHAPRNSTLVIHHGTGSVFMNDVTGDMEVTCGRGDIVLMLSDGGYSIDARSKFGVVTSDFEGPTHINRYRLGERYATANTPSSPRIHLRMGFGGIAIKTIPREATVGERAK